MTGPTRAPATLAADLAALSEQEREAITNCDCGHSIGGEHNGLGCYGVVTYGPPTIRCDCTETDDRPGVNYAAVERILADRLRHLVTLDAALDWVAEQLEALAAGMVADTSAGRGQVIEHWRGADYVDGRDTGFEDAAERVRGLLAALRDRAAPRAPQPDTTHDTKEQP